MKTFDEVYEEYSDMLFKIAFMYFGNTDDSEDAIQEVFLKYFRLSPSFKDGTHEKAWLIRVMQNTCLNMLKSPARKTCDIESLQIPYDTPDREARMDILQKIISLPPKYKSTVLLYYYYSYSIAEIAHILKTSQSAVKMRLKRGRELLKKELEGYQNA